MDAVQAAASRISVKDAFGERTQRLFREFLEEYVDRDGKATYKEGVEELTQPERNTLKVSLDHIESHNHELASNIQEEYYRVLPYLQLAVQSFAFDLIALPKKQIYISFTDSGGGVSVRNLKTKHIGTLVKIMGQVIRTHPVHPELVSGTFVCANCQNVISGIEQQFKYTQPSVCTNAVCNNRVNFTLDVNKSVFVDFQKVRIQETQGELPRGAIPRSIDVILRGEQVEYVQPGDRCAFTGTLIVIPDISALSLPGAPRTELKARQRHEGDLDGVRGLKALGVRELSYRMAFLVSHVKTTSKGLGSESDENLTPEMLLQRLTPGESETLYNMSQDPQLYNKLCNSIFPAVYGSEEVKRGILLMLFGGTQKVTSEGTHLRGDINVCIVGDPSTAKSRLLKAVEEFVPRAVYTSGKASTAAGLTAAVVKDEDSFEFVIEAGALMLADNGVCCIDEFDKMDLKDQVAIHEAMEQQTISITKAGVRATINARTSILAAANPIGGRYNRFKSLRQNVALTAPLMSRFDLFFVLVDECNELTDYAIARKIVGLRRNQEEDVERAYSVADVQRYIAFARQFRPQMSKEAEDYLVTAYKQLRQRDSAAATGGLKSSWRVTVRQLESMIRLSEALARLYCVDVIQPKHVKEAARLLSRSIVRVEQPDIELEDEMEEEVPVEDETLFRDPTSEIVEPIGKTQKEKKATKLTFESYKQIANPLILYLRRSEERDIDKDGDIGLHRSELIEWYLTQIEEEIEGEADLLYRKSLIEKVIHHLVYKDRVLIELSRVGLSSKSATQSVDSDPVLVVHPNYIVES